MDKKQLKKLIEDNASLNQIAKKVGKSQSTVRHWLRKYGLKTKRGPRGKLPKDFKRKRKCKCGETRPDKFYGNKTTVCAKCHSKYTHESGKKKRKKALEYLGNKCVYCEYNKYDCSIEIHHLNPEEKDTAFSSMRNWSWKRLEKELQKCVLLCKNCHAALHNGHIKI
jgi:hypothetical protein